MPFSGMKTRRQILKTAGLAAMALTPPATGLAETVTDLRPESGADEAAGSRRAATSGMAREPDRGRDHRVIDFRIRPPFRSFRSMHAGAPTASSDDELMERFLAEMDGAGIDMGVVMGRTAPAPGIMHGTKSNDDVAALVRAHPTRFVGFGSVDVRDPLRAVAEVDRCAELDLRGIAFDNPLSLPPLHNDDESLLPVYERCAEKNLVISINASAMIGPDVGFSDPARIQRVASRFPEHPVVVTHACWPYSTQMVGVAMAAALSGTGRIYFQCDYALMPGVPGGRDYLEAANVRTPAPLYERILFGSSYPAMPLVDAVREFDRYEFEIPHARRHILWDNAAEMLGLA